MYLTLALAIVQSLAISLYLPLQTDLSPLLVVSLNALIMIAGTFFLVWLADLNTALGLGNSIVIMMAGMLLYLPEDVLGTLSKSGGSALQPPVSSASLVRIYFHGRMHRVCSLSDPCE